MPPDADLVEKPAAEDPAGSASARVARTGILPRLFGLVLVALLPALAIQAYNEIAGRQTREAELRDDALRLALSAAGEMDRIVENARPMLGVISESFSAPNPWLVRRRV